MWDTNPVPGGFPPSTRLEFSTEKTFFLAYVCIGCSCVCSMIFCSSLLLVPP